MNFRIWLENSTWYFSFPTGHIELPVVFIRFGNLPKGPDGKPTASSNGLTGKKEKGISVYPAYHHEQLDMYVLPSGHEQFLATQGEVGDRPAFLVTGTPIGYGGDDEPVLDPTTIRIIKEIPLSKIVSEQDKWMPLKGDDLPPERTPWLPGEKEAQEKQDAQYRASMDARGKEDTDRMTRTKALYQQYIKDHPEEKDEILRAFPHFK